MAGGVKATIDILRDHCPNAVWHEYDTMGDFTAEDMGTTAFPDLLTAIGRADDGDHFPSA